MTPKLRLKYRLWRSHKCGKYTPRTGNSTGAAKVHLTEGTGIRRRTYLGCVAR
jgi:hypothetical protein